MEQTVDFFRLVTGEDIVSEYEMQDDCYRLINPCKIVYLTSAKPGFLSISLMQWVFAKISVDQVFDLPKNQVLIRSSVSDSMMDHYFSSVDHFAKSEMKKKIDFDDPVMDDYVEEDFSSEEGLNLLQEIMDKLGKNKNNKGKLH